MTKPNAYSIEPIGTLESPFKQKFAIPRQPALAKAKGRIKLTPPFSDPNSLRQIDTYSHLWLLFLFHENLDKGWSPTVRAPRLGGNTRTGVFATRSTFRPNGIGMSAVENLGVEHTASGLFLHVGNIDLLHGTPIIDIKPYIPYSDAIQNASATLLDDKPVPNLTVNFTEQARAQLARQPQQDLPLLIENCLSQDPRPAYKQSQQDDPKGYQVQLYDADIHWRVSQGEVWVTEIVSLA